KSYAQLYNDQFHANAQGQVTFADGTVVYVPPAFNAQQLTVPSTTPGAIPLTITALSTPGNAYYTNPTAINGLIGPNSNGGPVLAVVEPVHGPIATGQTGLPMSQLQINPALSGITIPGVIKVSQGGDVTTGYGQYSFTFTNVYSVPEGMLKGVRIGGTVGA